MISTYSSTRFLQNTIKSLYPYGIHIQLTAITFAFLETTASGTAFPKSFFLFPIYLSICFSAFYIFIIARSHKEGHSRVSKSYRQLLLLTVLIALCWGSSIFFTHDGTLLFYATHTLYLSGISILFSIYLAALPKIAYSFLTISVAPMLYTLYFKVPADINPLAHCLLGFTTLIGIAIYFRAKAIHNTLHERIADKRTLHDLKKKLENCDATAKHSSIINTLSDLKTELQKLTEQKTTCATARNDAIWNTILTITDQSHLQNSWQNCFSGKLSSLCQPLEVDRIYIIEASANTRVSSPDFKAKYPATVDHSWVFNNPDCIAILQKGKIIHNQSPQLSKQDRNSLQELGIQAFIDIPILLKNNLWGVIGMDRLTAMTPFTDQQIKGLTFIAHILSMTIRNQQDRSERDRLVTAVEQSNDCTLIADPAGKILYANPACEPITGYLRPELIGMNIKELYPETVMDSNIWKQIITALKNGEQWQGQFANHRKDHTLYEEEMFISPAYDHDGKFANQVIVKRNITEKKRLESIVEAANLMDNIGFIFSSIRHELGNPINSIKVSLSVLDSNLEIYNKNDIKRFINRSLSDIGRVEYLLKTLKNFSIFERPIIEKTDITALLTEFIPLVTTDLQQKNIRLTANIPKEPRFGMIDPRAFQQVLLNLIANAADSLADCSEKNISLTMLREKNGAIDIIIGDNGCGISEDEQINLFKPFFTTKPQGTGLGLVIVKKMLSKMNCSIEIRSKNNIGTKVLIIIPGH